MTFHETSYYEPLADGKVHCLLCPNSCTLGDGQMGVCHNRMNQGGRLVSLAYANVASAAIDPIEKKPLLHFYPGSKAFSVGACGCNLSCRGCQNWTISQTSPLEAEAYRLAPEDLPTLMADNDCRIAAYTYTEPLTYIEYVRDSARLCHERGFKNVLVTAGYVNEHPLRQLMPLIDAVNIDLKAFTPDAYLSYSHARLDCILRSLLIMKESGSWIEITNLVIPGVNDSIAEIKAMCQWLVDNGFADTPLHFSRFFPNYKLQNVPPTPIATLQEARQVARDCGINYVYIGNTTLHGAEDTLCPHCGKTVVRRDGYVILSNDVANGKCPHCGSDIAGRWSWASAIKPEG